MTVSPASPITAATADDAAAAPAVRRIPLELVARRLVVQRTEDLSRSMRRVVLGGEEVAGFTCHGPTDHAKVFFPTDPGAPPAVPELVDGRWAPPAGQTLLSRDYTIRTHTPSSGEVVIDMVLGHGPAGRWAAQAVPGQELGVLGPKSSKIPPMDRDWYVLAADETGLPALTNWLERLPEGPRVQAFVEVGGPEDEVALPVRDGVTVTWLHRGDAPAGTTTLLPDAVAAADLTGGRAGDLAGGDLAGGRGDGTGWVWAAAEAMVVRAIRRHVTHERGLGRDSFAMTGYWRAGVADFDHHSPEATS